MYTRELILRNLYRAPGEKISAMNLEGLIRRSGIVRSDRIKEYVMWLVACQFLKADTKSTGDTRYFIIKEGIKNELLTAFKAPDIE